MSNISGMKDVVHKLQLCLLEGIKSETQLFVAGSLLSKSDYHDVVTERSIAQTCGYPVCPNPLPSPPTNKGSRYRISLKEHKVYDLLETRMYCSTKCLVDSRVYAESLQDERPLVLDTSKIDNVVRLFDGLEEGLGDNGDFGLNKLSIKENEDEGVGEGIVSLEEWIGPSNAIEGYIPQHDRTSKNRREHVSGSKMKDSKVKREEESIFGEVDFMSSIIITQDDGSSKNTKPKNSRKKMNRKNDSSNELKDEEPTKISEIPCRESEPSCNGLKSSLKSSCAISKTNRCVSWADDGHHNQKLCDFSSIMDDHDDNEIVSEDPEPGRIKWPKKTGVTDTELFDSEYSWFDTTPEEFVLDLSPFASMFMSLFAWISSSTLAYVYGHNEEYYYHYASVNGREYPRIIVLAEGRSSEIKKTLASCLSRALPPLLLHLRLPTPVSTIESAMGCLLDTMSFVDALPPLRMKQWQVFVLLFVDALSVSRIPAMAPHLTNTRTFFQKVYDDAGISGEEYEVLKDLILPLGRNPQFATQSGA